MVTFEEAKEYMLNAFKVPKESFGKEFYESADKVITISRPETFEDYLQRLKDRRTEDNYKYTDEDFKNHIYYIFDCYEKDLSVYKCLEFMYFAEKEPIQELGILEVPMPISKEKLEECLETAAIDYRDKSDDENTDEETMLINVNWYDKQEAFIAGAKWQQEQRDFLPGFIKQFDSKEGEINGEEWTAVHFLKWLELNKFKIVK